MLVYKNEERKEVEVWVSNSDPESEIENVLTAYRGTYFVIIFRSGRDDLTSCTKALIQHNYVCA